MIRRIREGRRMRIRKIRRIRENIRIKRQQKDIAKGDQKDQ